MGKISCVEFQRYPLTFHTKIVPLHWKKCVLFICENLRVREPFFKSPPRFVFSNKLQRGQVRIRVLKGALRWRRNGHDGVSNHQAHHCLLNRLFRCRSKKTSKLHVAGLCAGKSPGTGEFPAQMASNAENISIWWRHHGTSNYIPQIVGGNYLSLILMPAS